MRLRHPLCVVGRHLPIFVSAVPDGVGRRLLFYVCGRGDCDVTWTKHGYDNQQARRVWALAEKTGGGTAGGTGG